MVFHGLESKPEQPIYEETFFTLFELGITVRNYKEFRNDGLKHFAPQQVLFYSSISSPAMLLCPLKLIDSEGNSLWEKYFLAVMMGYTTAAFF